MYDLDIALCEGPTPVAPSHKDIMNLQLLTNSMESYLNIIEDALFRMKDLDLCHSVCCEGWSVEAYLATLKLSPVVADGRLTLPTSCRNMSSGEMEVHLEMDFVYNTVKFIKDILKAIFTGLKEAITWFIDQFKPSTHYHGMLKNRKRTVLGNLKNLDTSAFKKTVLLMESYEDTAKKIGAVLLIYEELQKLFKTHTSVMDDTRFEHRRVFDEPLKTLGYYIDSTSQKIKSNEYHAPLESKPLEDLGWSVTNIQNSIDRVLMIYERQGVLKDLVKRLEQLIDDTKDTERRMKKVTDDYGKLSKEKERVIVLQKEVLFLTSLGKVLMNTSSRIAHQYIVLTDKIESLKRR